MLALEVAALLLGLLQGIGLSLLIELADEPGSLAPTCGHRVLFIRPVTSLEHMMRCCASAAPHLQALAVSAAPDRSRVAESLAWAGLNRVCALGTLQRPPLDWIHDGIGSLAPLVRIIPSG